MGVNLIFRIAAVDYAAADTRTEIQVAVARICEAYYVADTRNAVVYVVECVVFAGVYVESQYAYSSSAAYVQAVMAIVCKRVDFIACMLVAAEYVSVGFQNPVISVCHYFYQASCA